MVRIRQFRSDEIFIPEFYNSSSTPGNMITSIIGPNGSGKSKILSSVAKIGAITNIDDIEFNIEGHFTSILALSNLPSDSFLYSSSHKNNASYKYLGLRTTTNSISTRSTVRTAEESFMELRFDGEFTESIKNSLKKY